MKRKSLLLYCITVLTLMLSSNPVSGETKYLYAYGITTADNRLVVKAIDPSSVNTAKDIVTISLTQEDFSVEVYPSPNREWLVLVLNQHIKEALRLVNVLTGEIRNIPVDLVLFDESYIFGRKQILEWSPDNRYLAFIGSEGKALIYIVQNKELVPLAADIDVQYSLTWLHNGSQLAILGYTCASPEDCTYRVDIFGMATRSLQTLINVAHFDWQPGSSVICRLQGAPNGQHISFMKSCYPSALASSKELYIVDVGQKRVTQVTNFSSRSDVSPDKPDYVLYADYEPFWYDDQTLLFGAKYFSDRAATFTKTIALQVTNGSSTTLNSNMTGEWEFNSHTKEFAVLTYTIANTDENKIQNSAVQIGTYSGDRWIGRITAPGGCNLAWSPEGAYLAYTAWGRTPNSCAVNMRRDPEFLFVDRVSGHVKRYVPPLDRDSDEEALLIGWIAAPTNR